MQLRWGQNLAFKKNYADAETMLLEGYEGLKARAERIPPAERANALDAAVRSLVRLYQDWGKTNQAAKWRKLLPADDKE